MARGHHYRPTEAHMGEKAMRADGGKVSHHEGKHHVVHHGEHDEVHHHHYARGGEIKESERRIPEEREGKMESYTAKPNNVEDEAEGEMRKRGGKAMMKKRARGGHVAEEHEEKREEEKREEKEREHRADGGHVERKKHKTKMVEGEGEKNRHRRLDRPGRKRGGGVNSDVDPFTAAHAARPASAHKADADELAS